MGDMMRACWSWMMSFGWAGLLLGLLLLALLVYLVVVVVRRTVRGSS